MEQVANASVLIVIGLPDSVMPDQGPQELDSSSLASIAPQVSPSAPCDDPPSAPPMQPDAASIELGKSAPPHLTALKSERPLSAFTNELPSDMAHKLASWPTHACTWEVAFAPGVRVRAQPRIDGHVIGLLRQGSRVQAEAASGWLTWHPGNGAWLRLPEHGANEAFVQAVSLSGEPLLSPFVDPRDGTDRLEGSSLPTPSAPEERGSSVTWMPESDEQDSSETAEMAQQVRERDRAEQAAEDAEIAEDDAWEAEAPNATLAMDQDYLEAGCAAAAQLMYNTCAMAIRQCHTAGGVVIALDRGCALLGHAGRREYAAVDAIADALPRITLDELNEACGNPSDTHCLVHVPCTYPHSFNVHLVALLTDS
jgi:hypothetical protein